MSDSEPNPWETLHVLSAAVTDATRRVERDSKLNEDRIAASVRKMRWWRFAGVVGAILAPLALWAGVQANNAVDELRDQRHASRIIACEKDNDTATKVNALNDRTQQLLRNAVAGGTRTPEQEARTQAFLNSELGEYEKIKVPMRQCDPASVERFYSKP
jgi:hypothetical protein